MKQVKSTTRWAAALTILALTAALAPSADAATYSAEVLADSPVHYWSFDEAAAGTGTAFDTGSGASGTNGTFVGTATRTAGLAGVGAAQLSGTAGDGVSVGTANYSFTTGVTIEALIKPDPTIGAILYSEIFRKEDGGNRLLFSFQNNGTILSFGMNDGGGYSELDMPLDGNLGRPTLADLTDGNAHHVAATYDAATGEKAIYVDGNQVFTAIRTPTVNMISGGGATAYIGNTSTLGEPFDGVIDETALYSSAQAQERIVARALAAGINLDRSVVLSTEVLGPGQYGNGYNNNPVVNGAPGNSTVELVRFIANSDASPLLVDYNQAGATIDFSSYVVSGATAGNLGSDIHGRGSTLFLPGDGETLTDNNGGIGIGGHANKLITFDLDDLRDVHLGGSEQYLHLTGRFGMNGRGGPTETVNPAGLVQGLIFLDGELIFDSALKSTLLPSDAIDLFITSGRWLTFAVVNGDASSFYDDGTFRDLTLATVPTPAALPAGLALLTLAATRRRRPSRR